MVYYIQRLFITLWLMSCISAAGLAAVTGDCHAGWYCIQGSYQAEPVMPDNITEPTCTSAWSNYTGGQCWPGSFCPLSSSYPTECTAGTYCADSGLTDPSGDCFAGFYCPQGSVQADPPATPCTAGHYCEAGSPVPTACPQGTYSNTIGN